MSIVSLRSASTYAGNILTTKIRKKQSGFTTAVSAVILIAAVSILGSVMVIWANTTFNAQRQQIGDYYETNSNLLKETFIVEDVWLSKNPANYVNITIRNIGDISLNMTEVKIIALNSTGTTACTGSCEPGTSATKLAVPINKLWVLGRQETLRVDVANIDWDHVNSKSLDISVKTKRGSIERIIWKVT